MFVAVVSFALLQADDGCGYEPPPDKGPGEPCTRSNECQSSLVCSGGVCMERGFDAGSPPRDAGSPPRDASMDAAPLDAAQDAGNPGDAAPDAGDAAPDASGPADASLDAGDAAPIDAATDSGVSADGGGT